MVFKAFGDAAHPTIKWIHGGTLSWWSLPAQITDMACDYHVVTPVLDGHGEAGDALFVSIEASAEQVLAFIDTHFDGSVFALGGVSLGGQIVAHMLTRRPSVARYAVIESALAYPIRWIHAMAGMISLFYELTRIKCLATCLLRVLGIPDTMFDQYYKDRRRISRRSFTNIVRSHFRFEPAMAIANTTAKVLIIVGEREQKLMKKSARRLCDAIPGSMLYRAKRMAHAQISMTQPKTYSVLLKAFFNGELK